MKKRVADEVSETPFRLSKFDGKCAHCGEAYHVGDRVNWNPRIKGTCCHAGCYAAYVEMNYGRDLAMMKDARRWQNLYLPLKHRTRVDASGMSLLGFVIVDETSSKATPTVYVGCVYFKQMGIRFEDLPKEEYTSLEAVVADGWRVD